MAGAAVALLSDTSGLTLYALAPTRLWAAPAATATMTANAASTSNLTFLLGMALSPGSGLFSRREYARRRRVGLELAQPAIDAGRSKRDKTSGVRNAMISSIFPARKERTVKP